MTNRERWLIYTSELCSPINYIEWSFRYLIAAALQRRVWMGPDNQQCFANMYTILVGPPGTGKGLPIREVSNFLSHYKLKDAIKPSLNGLTSEQLQTIEATIASNLEKANEYEMQASNKKEAIEPTLIPVAADATTYEALVKAVGTNYRWISYIINDATTGQPKLKAYGHSSVCFCLQELASLLRKRTDDTVNFMLGLYDCPTDYIYDTKTKGKDRIRRGCLNLLAGTTPSFMQSIFNEALIDEGFSSRSFFIYANKARRPVFFIKNLTDEQRECRKAILEHILKLTTLYGKVEVSADTWKWLEEWWIAYCGDAEKRANKSPKMAPYYARKNIHVMKVAMAEHFADSTELCIPLETFQKAIHILEEEEKNMHLAITMEGKNPLVGLAKKILDLLDHEDMNMVDLKVATWEMQPNDKALQEALDFLIETSQIKVEQVKDEMTEKETIIYKRKK